MAERLPLRRRRRPCVAQGTHLGHAVEPASRCGQMTKSATARDRPAEPRGQWVWRRRPGCRGGGSSWDRREKENSFPDRSVAFLGISVIFRLRGGRVGRRLIESRTERTELEI